MSDFLERQLERVNYWLNFAEAKLAAVIALNIAAFAAVNSIDGLFDYVKGAADIMLIISLDMAVIGLSPKKNTCTARRNPNCTKNLIFYQYIASLDTIAYINGIEQDYKIQSGMGANPQGKNYSQQEYDLADEIVENSKIVVRKNKLFKWALRIDIASFVIIGIGVIFLFFACS